jgi:hypothetical protein
LASVQLFGAAALDYFLAQFAGPLLDARFQRPALPVESALSFFLLAGVPGGPVAQDKTKNAKRTAEQQGDALRGRGPVPHHADLLDPRTQFFRVGRERWA